MSDTITDRAKKIIKILKQSYATADIALEYSTPFELLIATILAAQCTDARVNQLTKTLYKKYRGPQDFLRVSHAELEKDIFSTGFYRAKAKNIKACCAVLIEKHGGEVPRDFEALHHLPGVGRKTASVVVGNAFGIPAIAVDTHVKRISQLLNLATSQNPDMIEEQLKQVVPVKDWVIFSHLLATHGRAVCNARKPDCKNCPISDYCPAAKI
jgi:endonuclease-3